MMAYPRMPILRTHYTCGPLLRNQTRDFFLTAIEQSKAHALLSLYFPRVLRLGRGGTTSCMSMFRNGAFPHEEMRFHVFYFLLLLENCELSAFSNLKEGMPSLTSN
jgi:hypothetical protein